MSDKEYLDGIHELQAMQQKFKTLGMLALMSHKTRLEQLTAAILAEAERRELARQGAQ
ncbi:MULTISPECIES: hypothetical protein [unclassified Halobacteriovorax]|uniref:hypothetical protein n=1 Tax=unclassified Halobacteriovorax TaxID=2639665 RepID=UPI00399A80C7